MRARPLLLSALALALPGSLHAQGELMLEPCSGGIGRKVDYRISGGQAFRPYLFFTSLQRGSFPLSAIDPRDSRSLGVGFDLLGLLLLSQFDGSGKAAFSLLLPNDPALAGRALLHQALAFPGTTTLFGAMSQVGVIPLEMPGAWRRYLQFAMNDKRAWISGIPLRDGKLLAVGGGTGAVLALAAVDTSEVYDPATRRFANGPKLTQPRGIHTTNQLPDGRWLLAGGVNQNNDPQSTCEFYDPQANRFVTAPPMVSPRMLHTATTLGDGRIFIAGGLTSLTGTTLQQIQSTTQRTEIYDPKNNSWSAGPSMTEPRAGHTAHRLADGRVILIAGVTLRTFLKIPDFASTVDVFDPQTGKLSSLTGTLLAKRAGQASAILANGKVLVAGGVGGSILPNGGSAVATCELYDFSTRRWTATASLRTVRALMSPVPLRDGGFAVLGGAKGSLTNLTAIPDCDVYDYRTGQWTALPALQAPRTTHVALELESCVLLVLGGGNGQAGALNTQELLYR